MNLARLALDNSRITVSFIFLIIAIGVSGFLTYPSAEDPSITIRSVSITTGYPGMAPERVEELITKPIEAAMREIAEIDEIKSSTKAGSTRLSLTIHDAVDDLEPVFQEIRNKVDDLTPKLPDGTSTPVVNDNEGLTAIASIALWADGFTLAEMRDVARDTRDRLYTLDGVRRIDILGVQEERIYLESTPARLAQLGVSPREVFGALADQNIIEPGGEITADGRTILLEPSGNLDSIDAIRDVVFAIPGTNRVLRLDEVVSIRRDLVDPPVNPAFFNNREAIVLAVSTVTGTNNVAFGERLTALLDEIQQEVPIGYVFDYATFQPELIAESVDGAVSNVYQTLAIVLAVVMIFLGVRTGLIVGFFVPLTMLLGIIVMRLMDVELQRMSIAATIIALGLLVDNAIVVAEDIRSRLERGADRRAAAMASGASLAIPLLTSSLTTIFAFMPMLLIEGAAGEYVRSLAQVVAILLLGSWLLSMTVTPAMCAWFMKTSVRPPEKMESGEMGSEESDGQTGDGLMYRFYRSALGLILRFRLLAIGALVAMLVGSIQLLGLVKTEFFPLGERSQFLIYLDFEAGTDLRETQAETRKLTGWLTDAAANPEITSNVAYIGFGGPRFFLSLSPVNPDPHRAFVLVNVASPDDIGPVIDRVNGFMDANLPGAVSDAKRMWSGGGSEPGLVQLRLIGPEGEVLAGQAEKIMAAFHALPGTVGIKHDWENKILKLGVEVDQTRARRAGVTSSDVAEALNTFFSGARISTYREGDKTIPIILRGDDDLRFSLTGIRRIQIHSAATKSFVSLDQVATVSPQWAFGRIERLDQRRTLTVEARNPDLPAPRLLAAMQPALDALEMPPGYRLELAGEIADQAEANGKLFGNLPLALAAIVLLLVGQFNSFRKGGIVIATIPLMLIGGTLGLLVMNAPYGFMVMLGFLSLAGILINNGIVLIDRIETETAAGHPPLEAVARACLARLRPILMTTLTTVLGLIPLILFGGPLFYGMASVIAFGLVVATLITLGFVPAVYTLLFRIPTGDARDVVTRAGR
ncbi:MAG: efflux RND transporter permease subunit [Alphaproteobacteria bacterium]|nr:efflux RND transporter permease subunit [Alphaproteobacteria bacterium]